MFWCPEDVRVADTARRDLLGVDVRVVVTRQHVTTGPRCALQGVGAFSFTYLPGAASISVYLPLPRACGAATFSPLVWASHSCQVGHRLPGTLFAASNHLSGSASYAPPSRYRTPAGGDHQNRRAHRCGDVACAPLPCLSGLAKLGSCGATGGRGAARRPRSGCCVAAGRTSPCAHDFDP